MAEQEDIRPEENSEETTKSAWQMQKESVYDKIPVTVKQLDIIIGVAIAGLVIVSIMIALEAMHII